MVEDGTLIDAAAPRPKRKEEGPAEGCIIKGVLVVAGRRVLALLVALGTRTVKAIERGTDRGTSLHLNRADQVVSQRCLSRRVNPIDRDPNRVGTMERDDSLCKLHEHVQTVHQQSYPLWSYAGDIVRQQMLSHFIILRAPS